MENQKPWGLELKSFLLLMHLSQFCGLVMPGAGIVMPIVMWATNKDEFSKVDDHGKVILNWVFSLLIYSVICIPLMFIFIGFFLFFILMFINLIFVIIGAVKANDDLLWRYPLSIPFFKVSDKSQSLTPKDQ